jgi:hypothetical protein
VAFDALPTGLVIFLLDVTREANRSLRRDRFDLTIPMATGAAARQVCLDVMRALGRRNVA